MRPQLTEVIEYDWNEQTGVSTFTYEDIRTGELTQRALNHPLPKPEVNEESKYNYFQALIFWLKTQPQERY